MTGFMTSSRDFPLVRLRGARWTCTQIVLLLCSVLGVISMPSHAAARDELGYDDARHLLARTGFGPTDGEVRDYVGLTRAQAVTRLLQGKRTSAVTPMPASLSGETSWQLPPGPSASAEERKAFQ